MGVYINMNISKINNPNDMYNLFRTKFCKELNKQSLLTRFFFTIMLFIPYILFFLFVIFNCHHFFLFVILYIYQILMDRVYSKLITNNTIKEKAEKIIKEILKNNMLELNYNTISILQLNTENFYNPFSQKKVFSSPFNYLFGLVTGIFSTVIATIIKDEIKTNDFYINLENLIIVFFNLAFLIINAFICLFFLAHLQYFSEKNFLKSIYIETLNDINFKLKLEEYNNKNEEKVKKSENNVNKIIVKINFKRIIDSDRTLNNPIKKKISYFYYQQHNRLNNKKDKYKTINTKF